MEKVANHILITKREKTTLAIYVPEDKTCTAQKYNKITEHNIWKKK
jgi:hypothetical protein